jgi:hypothetical protein
MSDEEGAMPFDVTHDVAPLMVIPAAGKGALDTWRSRGRSDSRTQSRGVIAIRSWGEPASKPGAGGVYARQRLSLAAGGKVSGGKPRSEPDSGNPTVRDRRGASGNVAMVEMGSHLAIERARLVTLCLQRARSSSIPTSIWTSATFSAPSIAGGW